MLTITQPKPRVEEEPVTKFPFTTGEVVSMDGTPIAYQQIGSGPGLLVLHGGTRAGHHYLRMAEALADAYTVYLPDRRGRGRSGPPGKNYSIEKEIADVKALLFKTGAQQIFGHSAGGFFALESALRLPIRKLVLYEPAVSIHGSMPLNWLPNYERALADNNPALAFTYLTKGLQMGPLDKLPNWVILPMARLMMRGEEGREMTQLLNTLVWEAKEMIRLEQQGQTYERYANIQAQTLLISGTKSPAYLHLAARELARTIPVALLSELADLDHNAPDENAPEQVAAEARRFLG